MNHRAAQEGDVLVTDAVPAASILTIDGPAGTGKSSVAHDLAARLGLEFLDTGAMYRAAALLSIEEDIDPDDGVTLAARIEALGMHFEWTLDPPALFLGETDVSERIRDADVARVVSIVAAQPAVRRVLVTWQRRIAQRHPRLVTEGRDQGSVVFPDAPLRFFLHADAPVRAERRAKQIEARGQVADRAEILAEIERRDDLDSSRQDAPLICPDGAVVIDTSAMTLDEVVAEMERIARETLPEAGFRA